MSQGSVFGSPNGGRLVRLADVASIESFGYHPIDPEAGRKRPKIAASRDWLLDAAGRA